MSTGKTDIPPAAGSMGYCEIPPDKASIAPFTMVIFGGSGDLSRRKLLPTLYHLCQEDSLPEEYSIIGIASSERTDEEYRELIKKAVQEYGDGSFDKRCWEKFSGHLYYMAGRFDDKNSYRTLSGRLEELSGSAKKGLPDIIYYMAVPPAHLQDIFDNLSSCSSCTKQFNTRVIVEKPFGHDRASAHELNTLIAQVFDENQVYRIDHYLGKETVQNILFFRFANSIFEPLWNRRYIDHVQITVAESIGIENRGRFYEKAGVIRDIVQNHMLQLLSLVAMEPPIGFEADYIRDEKVKVYNTVRPMDTDYIDRFTVCGQYGKGTVNNRPVPGFREEKEVPSDSITSTFFAAKLYIDNWRWAGVPFYLRTGKRLAKRITEISIHFRQPPLKLFSTTCEIREPNLLVLGIQPHEKISLNIGVKHPGIGNELYPVIMNFNYEKDLPGNVHFALPYERLLLDCMKGDQTLFARQDGIEAMWSVVDPVISRWDSNPSSDFPNYQAGSWGPKAADAMISQEGRQWRAW